jgi:hypothetical protein
MSSDRLDWTKYSQPSRLETDRKPTVQAFRCSRIRTRIRYWWDQIPPKITRKHKPTLREQAGYLNRPQSDETLVQQNRIDIGPKPPIPILSNNHSISADCIAVRTHSYRRFVAIYNSWVRVILPSGRTPSVPKCLSLYVSRETTLIKYILKNINIYGI